MQGPHFIFKELVNVTIQKIMIMMVMMLLLSYEKEFLQYKKIYNRAYDGKTKKMYFFS